MRDIALQHLTQVPLHRALVRTAEAYWVRRVALEPPVLDAGCGDGIFATLALPGKADVGVDLDHASLSEAAARRWHRLIVQSRLEALPIASGSLGSIVCNSVIEHVPAIDSALAELARALRPGGMLVLTTPTPTFTEMLLTYRLLSLAGLRGLADAYGAWFNRMSRHHHFFDLPTWEAKLKAVGLELIAFRHYLADTAMATFELAHYLEAFRLIIKRLSRRWVLFPRVARRSPTVRLKARLVASLCARTPEGRAGYVLLVARKHLAPGGEQ